MFMLNCFSLVLNTQDCCDGSDEYDGQVKCPNTWWEAGKVARDGLIKKIATYKEGAALRKLEVEKAKVAISKEEAELTLLKNEEKVLKVRVGDLKGKHFSMKIPWCSVVHPTVIVSVPMLYFHVTWWVFLWLKSTCRDA